MKSEHTATTVPIELLRKYDRPGPRYTSYPTAPVWTDEVGPETYVTALNEASSAVDTPLSIYCHIPFCRKRCWYCGCNTCIINKRDTVKAYLDTMLTEIDATVKHLGKRTKVSQLHFGGGTPTYLTNDEMGVLLDRMESAFDFLPDCERSIELDPRVTTSDQIDFLTSRAFNRVSLGVQDFTPEVQEASGRVQPFEMVADLVAKCRSKNVKGINIDLIFGLPKQTVENFTESLRQAIELRPDRVAVYSFAFLPNLKGNQKKIDPADLPDTETKYRLFARAIELFTGAGYRQIGMDHFALPDDELALAQDDGKLHRNFMGYTVKTSPDMIGLGMSSIGYINNSFFQNHSKLDAYGKEVADKSFAVYRGLVLSEDDLIRQYVITSLMCNFTLDFTALQERFGVAYDEYFKGEHGKLKEFFDDGFLTESDGRLDVTPVGRTFVRNIAMTYDAYLNKKAPGRQPQFSRTI